MKKNSIQKGNWKQFEKFWNFPPCLQNFIAFNIIMRHLLKFWICFLIVIHSTVSYTRFFVLCVTALSILSYYRISLYLENIFCVWNTSQKYFHSIFNPSTPTSSRNNVEGAQFTVMEANFLEFVELTFWSRPTSKAQPKIRWLTHEKCAQFKKFLDLIYSSFSLWMCVNYTFPYSNQSFSRNLFSVQTLSGNTEFLSDFSIIFV